MVSPSTLLNRPWATSNPIARLALAPRPPRIAATPLARRFVRRPGPAHSLAPPSPSSPSSLRRVTTAAEASLDPEKDPLTPAGARQPPPDPSPRPGQSVDPSSASRQGAANRPLLPGEKLGYLYMDSVFPLTLGFWDLRRLFVNVEAESLLQKLKQSLPRGDVVGHGFEPVGAEPRPKDGGAFLSFRYRPYPSEAEDVALQTIEHRLKGQVKRIYSPALALVSRWGQPPSVHVVRGKPWRDDLDRFPARHVRVSFEPAAKEGGGATAAAAAAVAPDEQTLWEVLRPYGRIVDLAIDRKENVAQVSFHRMRGATSARNCAHGFTLPGGNGARMLINFAPRKRGHQFWEWTTSHPRIVLPLLAVSLGTLTYAVFDPIRAFFIESKLEETFNIKDYRLYAWLRSNTVGLFEGSGGADGANAAEDDWWERREAAAEIQGWLKEKPSTFITISGPRGSGKHPLLQKAITKDVKHLRIDCEAVTRKAKTDTALVPALAQETGYFPVFGWIGSLGNMLDLAAVGLMGSKAGFATPPEQQLKQMLGVATAALVHVNDETRKRKEREAKRAAKEAAKGGAGKAAGGVTALAVAPPPTPALSATDEKAVDGRGEPGGKPDAKFSSPEARRPDGGAREGDELGPDSIHLAPERGGSVGGGGGDGSSGRVTKASDDEAGSFDWPVIVVDGFHHKGLKSALLWDVLAEWGAELTSNQVAHVVFVTDNPVAQARTLSRAMPNVPFKSIVLADADTQRARHYVVTKLRELGRLGMVGSPTAVAATSSSDGAAPVRDALAQRGDPARGATPTPTPTPTPQLSDAAAGWIDLLGGRLTDLEQLVQKMALGESVEGAVRDLVAREVVQLRKGAFGDDAEDAKNLPWSREQAWKVVSSLAKNQELSYYSLLHEQLKGDEAALKAMEQAEIVSVRHVDSRPSTVRAGRPILQRAVECLVDDAVFADTQSLLSGASALASKEREAREAEHELRELAETAQQLQASGGFADRAALQAYRRRASYLVRRLDAAQAAIETLDAETAEIKGRLAAVRGE